MYVSSQQQRHLIADLSHFVALRLHLIAKHLETVKTCVVDAPGLAFRTETPVAGRELIDAPVEPDISLRYHLPALLQFVLQVPATHRQDLDDILRVDALEECILLQLRECLPSREFDAFLEHAHQTVCLGGDEELHAARPSEEVLLATFLHLTDLVLLSERQQVEDI